MRYITFWLHSLVERDIREKAASIPVSFEDFIVAHLSMKPRFPEGSLKRFIEDNQAFNESGRIVTIEISDKAFKGLEQMARSLGYANEREMAGRKISCVDMFTRASIRKRVNQMKK